MNQHKQTGFTLIELIMVIVILGILAAVALPKFANLGGQARSASINGLAGAISSAVAITKSAYLAGGGSGTTATLSSGNTVTVASGTGVPAPTTAGIIAALDTLTGYSNTATDSTTSVTFTITGYTPSSGSCNVVYDPAAATLVTVNTGGC